TRLPKEGYYHIETVPDYNASAPDDDQHHNVRRFIYAGTDIQPWHNLQDAEVVAVETCSANRLPIREVDVEKRLVTFDRPSRGNLMYGRNRPHRHDLLDLIRDLCGRQSREPDHIQPDRKSVV